MTTIRDIIVRNPVTAFIPFNASKYIEVISPNILNDDNREQFESAFTPEYMLLNKDIRPFIINSLREEECRNLMNRLGIKQKEKQDIWDAVNDCLDKGTYTQFKTLFKELQADSSTLDDYFVNFCKHTKYEIKDNKTENIVSPDRVLFEHQRKALLSLESNFFSSQKNKYKGLLHMPTGSGKTRTAAMMACRYLLRYDKGLVIWLADTRELCDQAYDELSKSWKTHGDRPIHIYRAYRSLTPNWEDIKSGIFVLGLQTANRHKKELLTLAKYEPFIIFDEAHKTTAETYSQTVDILFPTWPSGRRSRLLGLSATPGRSTFIQEENQKLIKGYDSFIVTLDVPGYKSPIDYLIKNEYLAKANFVRLASNFDFAKCCKNLGIKTSKNQRISRDKIEKIEKTIENDKERNALVFQAIVNLAQQGHKRILVFACSTIQAARLAFMLRFFKFDAVSVDSDTDAEQRAEIIASFKTPIKNSPETKIICNYNILTTGFDAPETSAVVVARPTTSLVLYSQMIGRALRGPKAGGNKTATIVTVIDNNLPSFWDIQKAFTHWNNEWVNSLTF